MIRAKPEVEALTPYVAPLEGRRSLLRLDFNESTVGPSPRVVDAIRSLPPDAYGTYPEYAGLNEAYATTLGVPASHVEAFNGVDAAIRAVFDAYGEKGSTFLTTVPTFGYYEPCAQQHGMVIDEVPYADDLQYPLAAITRKLEARPRLLFVCNPNNPTGTLLAPPAIAALARSAPQTLVVVDDRRVPASRWASRGGWWQLSPGVAPGRLRACRAGAPRAGDPRAEHGRQARRRRQLSSHHRHARAHAALHRRVLGRRVLSLRIGAVVSRVGVPAALA